MKIIFFYFLLSLYLFSQNLNKKIIYYGWGTRDTIYVKENYKEMEKMPFDGITITIPINRNKPTIGDGATGNILGWQLFSPKKFEYSQFKESIEDLKVPRWEKFKYNFLPCAIATRGQDFGLNWFDDERWKTIYNNWEIYVRITKEGNLKGIFIDFEHYDYECELFRYQHHKQQRADKPFSEYKEVAKRRGKDLIEITKRIYPDITILMACAWPEYLTHKLCGRQSDEENRYSLLPSFLDGFLEGSSEKMKFVVLGSHIPKFGFKSPYGFMERIEFLETYHCILNQCLSQTEFPDIYRKRVYAGFPVSFDHPHHKEWNTENISKNYFTPEKFYTALKIALEITDEYVWIYTERPKFFPKQNLPDEYIEVMRKVRKEMGLQE